MKNFKILTAVLLSVVLMFTATSCGFEKNDFDKLKDSVIDGFDDLLNSLSKLALTKSKDLVGTRTETDSTYTGSYSAEYRNFSGVEYLFGGTSLEHTEKDNLNIKYKLSVTSGKGKLYWIDKNEEIVIADYNSDSVFYIPLTYGDNYLAFEGDDFTGSLQILAE